MKSPYHSGELGVQERAGVRNMAARVGHGIRPTIPPPARDFLKERPLVVAATTDARGWVWASLLTGPPGFVEAVDETSVRIAGPLPPHDPLDRNLERAGPIGLLAIDLATRRRMRVNGRAERESSGLLVHATEVFANCPKYIQARDWERAATPSPAREVWKGENLDAGLRSWIEGADTFFIASFRPETGADASHRGGRPGFVRVPDKRTVVWPDYQGNGMFQTLGNIASCPRVGLLFLDFDTDRTLQLTGRARIDWNPERAAGHAGAERMVEFTLDRALVVERGGELRWRFRGASPFNPE